MNFAPRATSSPPFSLSLFFLSLHISLLLQADLSGQCGESKGSDFSKRLWKVAINAGLSVLADVNKRREHWETIAG